MCVNNETMAYFFNFRQNKHRENSSVNKRRLDKQICVDNYS